MRISVQNFKNLSKPRERGIVIFNYEDTNYPPTGSGDILPVYACKFCEYIVEPTTEKVADISIRNKMFRGIICTACSENAETKLKERYGDVPSLKLLACYSLYKDEKSDKK